MASMFQKETPSEYAARILSLADGGDLRFWAYDLRQGQATYEWVDVTDRVEGLSFHGEDVAVAWSDQPPLPFLLYGGTKDPNEIMEEARRLEEEGTLYRSPIEMVVEQNQLPANIFLRQGPVTSEDTGDLGTFDIDTSDL